MVVLVTGGAGYLGSELIRRLAEEPAFKGQTIRILDNMFRERYSSLWHLPLQARYHFIEGDVLDLGAQKRAMEGVETVFALADITNAQLSFDRDKLTWQVNYLGALNTLEAAVAAGVKKYIYTSSCSVYGQTDGSVTEEAECKPVSPYGEAKLAAERDMKIIAESQGMDWTALRLGTVHGWSRGMRFDTVVNRFSYLAAIGEPLAVYKNAWTEKRPYVHISDVMRAYMLAAAKGRKCEIYNVVGQNADMEDVVTAVQFAAWWNYTPAVKVVTVDTPNLNQLSYEVDGSKFRELGFGPKMELREGPMQIMAMFKHVAPLK